MNLMISTHDWKVWISHDSTFRNKDDSTKSRTSRPDSIKNGQNCHHSMALSDIFTPDWLWKGVNLYPYYSTAQAKDHCKPSTNSVPSVISFFPYLCFLFPSSEEPSHSVILVIASIAWENRNHLLSASLIIEHSLFDPLHSRYYHASPIIPLFFTALIRSALFDISLNFSFSNILRLTCHEASSSLINGRIRGWNTKAQPTTFVYCLHNHYIH